MCESSNSLCISLATLDILGLKISCATDFWWKSTWHITINLTIGLIEGGGRDFHEVSVADGVTDIVLWVQWVYCAFALPVLRSNISIVDVAVASGTSVSSLPILGAFNILDVHDVAHWLRGWRLRASSLDIINHHLVSHEFICIWLHVVKALQFVGWVQRILWRLCSSGFELINTWLTSLDITVC